MRVAIVLLLVIPAFVLLYGCANGVQMTDDERIACRSVGCAVYTESELRDLVNRAVKAGYGKGWTDATVQAGRDL